MSGYFYAYASKAGCRSSRPEWFNEEGDLLPPRVLISTQGVPLTEPTYDADGLVLTPATMSDAYVVLSPAADGSEAKLIVPNGRQGFA